MTILPSVLRYINLYIKPVKLLILFSLLFVLSVKAQLSEEEFELVSNLKFTTSIPADLIASRSLVLYQNTYTKKELEETQSFFQQTGIDAVAYFDISRVLAGYDPRKAFYTYFKNRGIKFLILLQKNQSGYQFIFWTFNGTRDLADKNSIAWKQENTSLTELLRTIYRFAVSNLKKQNFLINDLPEIDITVHAFRGRINENFTLNVQSFKTAIPRFGIEKDDAELEAYLKDNLPVKFELVDAQVDEDVLLSKGFRTILRFVHARGTVAKDILGYDITQQARSLATNVYVGNEVQIKTIPADQYVYKFYFRNIEYGDIFLGQKWDADTRWQDALHNHIQALKKDQKIN